MLDGRIHPRLSCALAAGNRCLEGNRVDSSSTLGGAAFMDACQDVSGQAWRFVADGGAYRMQTMFLEPEDTCLEGNEVAPGATLDGAAFMDDCTSASDRQLYLAIMKASERWSRPIQDWTAALNHLSIVFEGRLPV